MGAYLSIPYVSRKTVECEPASKQNSTEQVTAEVKEESKMPEVQETVVEPVLPEVKDEEEKKEEKEEKKEEKKEEEKEERKKQLAKETQKEVMEIEVMMRKVNVSQLSITIPESIPEEEATPAIRAPEFRGQFNSESHAIKKYNKRHRKQ